MSPEAMDFIRSCLESSRNRIASSREKAGDEVDWWDSLTEALCLLSAAEGGGPKVTDWNLAAAIIAYRDASGKIPMVVGMRAALEKFLVTPEQMSLPPPRQEPPK